MSIKSLHGCANSLLIRIRTRHGMRGEDIFISLQTFFPSKTRFNLEIHLQICSLCVLSLSGKWIAPKQQKNLDEEWKSNQTRRAKNQTTSPGLCTWSYHVCLIHKNVDISSLFFFFLNLTITVNIAILRHFSRTWAGPASTAERNAHLHTFLLIISDQINDLISYRQSDVGRECRKTQA